MATSNNIGVVVYRGGGSDRPPIGARRVPRDIGYVGLISILRQMMDIDCNQYILKVSATICDNNRYHLIPINDDDDLWFFLAPDTNNRYVYLHVDTEELQTPACADVPLTNEYYQYAEYLRGDNFNSSVVTTEGLANVVINNRAARPSWSMDQNVHIERTNTFVEDPLIDNFGVNELENSEPDDSGSSSESGEDDVEVGDIETLYNQSPQNPPSNHQDTPPPPPQRYAMHPTIPFFNTSYPEIRVDSFDIPKKFRFYEATEGVLAKGMIFKDKKNLQAAVKDFSIRVARREYRVDESTTILWKVKCKSNKEDTHCNWWIRAGFKEKIDMWEITKYGGPHTCLMNAVNIDHQNLCKNMIAVLLTGMVQTDPGYEVKCVQQQVFDKYQYTISYHKAWHGLKRARENVFGTWESSVANLPRFLGAIQKWNSGTIVEWRHMPGPADEVKMLKYVFWAFKPCIDGFQH